MERISIPIERKHIHHILYIFLFTCILSSSSALEFRMQLYPHFSQTTILQLNKIYYSNSADNSASSLNCINFNDSIPSTIDGCKWISNLCKQTYSQITRLKFDANQLTTGTIFQFIEPNEASSGLKPHHLPDNLRKAFSIKLSNGLTKLFQGILNPDGFRGKLNAFLVSQLAYLNSQPVDFTIVPHTQTKSMLHYLGLSSFIYQNLQIARNNQFPIFAQNRICLIIHQKLFTTVLGNGSASLQNILQQKRNNTSQLIYSKMKQLTYDPYNPLRLITRTNYGRFLIFSLQYSKQSTDAFKELQNCSDHGNLKADCLRKAMKRISHNPKARHYFAGVDEALPYQHNPNGKSFLNWEKIFFQFNATSINYLRPFSAEANTLTGYKYFQTDYRYFQTEICQANVTIIVTIEETGNMLSSFIDRHFPSSKQAPPNFQVPTFKRSLFNTTHSATFQIGNDIGMQVFELKFLVTGRKKRSIANHIFFSKKDPIYNIQAEFAIMINGIKKLTKSIGNARSRSPFQQGKILVSLALGLATEINE